MSATISSKNVTKRSRNGRTPVSNNIGSTGSASAMAGSGGGGSSSSLLTLTNTWSQKQIFSGDIDILGTLSVFKLDTFSQTYLNVGDTFINLGSDIVANADGGVRIYGASSALLSTLQYTVASNWWDLDNPFMVNRTSLGASPALDTGISLKNSTPAAAGAQQTSPVLRLSGNGWKTDATAGSMRVDWVGYVLPVQGTAAPSATLIFASSINNGAITTRFQLTSAGALTVASLVLSGTLSGVTTIANSSTHTLTRTGLTTTSTDGFIITNTTAALVGTQVQYSPRIRLSGTVWDTGASASRTSNWIVENKPAAGNPATSKLAFSYDYNAGGYSEKVYFNNAGDIYANAGNSTQWNTGYSHSQITSGANPHSTTPVNIMGGRVLDANGILGGTYQSHSIRMYSNTTGSTNYPTEFGHSVTIDAGGTDRVFSFWKQAGTSKSLYLQAYDSLGAALGWNLMYTSGNSNLSTVDSAQKILFRIIQ